MTETTTGRADRAPARGHRASTRRPGSRQAEVTRLLPSGILVVVLVAICALIAIPLIYVVLSPLNSDLGVARGEFFPSSFSLENYANIWTTIGLGKGIANSLIVAGAAGYDQAVGYSLPKTYGGPDVCVVFQAEAAGEELASCYAQIGVQGAQDDIDQRNRYQSADRHENDNQNSAGKQSSDFRLSREKPFLYVDSMN